MKWKGLAPNVGAGSSLNLDESHHGFVMSDVTLYEESE